MRAWSVLRIRARLFLAAPCDHEKAAPGRNIVRTAATAKSRAWRPLPRSNVLSRHKALLTQEGFEVFSLGGGGIARVPVEQVQLPSRTRSRASGVTDRCP
mmetsp:Transcript_28419/g.23869  ORF Transcript_28419/g.23869 Transcript_28419/m.23869 type:complete len:100 (-) Transcript_28419:190-489(-)